MITNDEVLAGDSDFTFFAALVVTGGVLLLIAGSALAGSGNRWAIDRQVRNTA